MGAKTDDESLKYNREILCKLYKIYPEILKVKKLCNCNVGYNTYIGLLYNRKCSKIRKK